jgi:hypothetical protein
VLLTHVDLVADELIILTDDDFALEEGQRGWDDPVWRVTGKLREVKLDPAQVEAQMVGFVQVVVRIFRRADAEVAADAGLRLEEVELAVKISAGDKFS